MSKHPLVSVIIPCYNYGHLLDETLDSVLAQTYQHWECLIIDDGSTDRTREVAEDYIKQDKRFLYFYQENKGLSGARNTGLKNAKGKFLQFLDADDLLCETKLESQLRVFKENQEVDIVYGDVYIFENGQDHLTQSKKFNLRSESVSGRNEIIIESIVEDNFFLVHCPLLKKDKIQDLQFEENLKSLEDWNFWYKCALKECNFLYINSHECKVYVREHGGNMSMDRRRMWYNKALARRNIIEYSQQIKEKGKLMLNITSVRQIEKKHKQYLYLDLLRYHLMFGNIFLGLRDTLQYAISSKRYYFAMYEAAYWIKERVKFSFHG